MPKILFEGYRPGQGDGGRWVGVVEKPNRNSPEKGPSATDHRNGPPTTLKLPHGGSAIRSTPDKK